MLNVLDLPAHKTTSWIFVLINVAAFIQIVLGVIVATMFLTSMGGIVTAQTLVVAALIMFGSLILSLVLAGMAQGLRYLASLTEKS